MFPESLRESEGKLGLELSDLTLSCPGCSDSGCPRGLNSTLGLQALFGPLWGRGLCVCARACVIVIGVRDKLVVLSAPQSVPASLPRMVSGGTERPVPGRRSAWTGKLGLGSRRRHGAQGCPPAPLVSGTCISSVVPLCWASVGPFTSIRPHSTVV